MKFKPTVTIFTVLIMLVSLVFTNTQAVAKTKEALSEDPVIDLQQAIQIALANNNDMKKSLLAIHDADQQIQKAWSSVMPDVSASLNYTRNLEVPVNFLPEIIFNPQGDPDKLIPIAFGTDNNWSGGFTASQILFNGRAFVGISASSVYKTAQTESMRAAAQGVVTGTRVAYYQVLVAEEMYRLALTQHNRVSENLKDIEKLVEQGFVDSYSKLQLEVQLSNLEPQLTKAKYAIQEAKRDLLELLGLPLQLKFNVLGSLKSFDIFAAEADGFKNEIIKKIDLETPINIEEDTTFTQYSMDLRGDIRILDSFIKLQDKNLKSQISDFMPSLVASYNLNWNAAQSGKPVFFGDSDQRARSQVLMLGLSVPLFKGLSRTADIQQTKIEIKDLEIQKLQAQRKATNEILSSQQAIKEAYETSSALKKAIELAEKGYERARARYKNGLGSQQEVNDAELQLREAEAGYAQMVFGYLASKAQYDQAIGQVPFVGQDVKTIKENIKLK